jgi:hypothetical protein
VSSTKKSTATSTGHQSAIFFFVYVFCC